MRRGFSNLENSNIQLSITNTQLGIELAVEKKRLEILAHAIYRTRQYISSHQVYDKDADGLLARALYEAGLPEREAK